MQRMIRHEDGVVISDLEWQAIRQSAGIVACSHMEPLKQDPRAVLAKMHKKGFVKKHFPDEWFAALIALERSAPVLSLCARNWKADMVLRAVLDSLKSSAPVPPSRPSTPSLVTSSHPPPSSLVTSSSCALASHPTTPSSVAPRSQLSPRHTSFKSPHPRPRALSGLVESPQEPGPAGKAGPQAKHRCDPSQAGSVQKLARVPVGHLQILVQFNAGLLPPAPLSCRWFNPTRPPSWLGYNWLRGIENNEATGKNRLAAVAVAVAKFRLEDQPVEVRLLPNWAKNRTQPDFQTLRVAKGKGKGNPATMTDSNDDVATQPVSKSRLVTPVKDPRCKSPIWGAQVPRLATSSFGDLGEPAPPKTTHSKQDHATSCAKALSTRSAKAKASCPTTADDDDVATQPQSKSHSAGKVALSSEGSGCNDESAESYSHLQALQHDKLVLWVEKHKIESTGKRPTRRNLIDAIAGAPKSEQPSKEDIESIVKECKLKHITKVA
ncbi:hypothetical protein EDB84DRAFT_1569379 [Lactarius hengduanensis]|nr:hypothetical protein EDB84DRAFT_1569379 [Lactarius hengduanensis]